MNGITLTTDKEIPMQIDSFLICNTMTIFPNIFYDQIDELSGYSPDSQVIVNLQYTTVNADGVVSGLTSLPLSFFGYNSSCGRILEFS